VKFGSSHGYVDPDRAWQEDLACEFVDNYLRHLDPQSQSYYLGILDERPVYRVPQGPRIGQEARYFDRLNSQAQQQVIACSKQWIQFLDSYNPNRADWALLRLPPSFQSDSNAVSAQIYQRIGHIIGQDAQLPFQPPMNRPKRSQTASQFPPPRRTTSNTGAMIATSRRNNAESTMSKEQLLTFLYNARDFAIGGLSVAALFYALNINGWRDGINSLLFKQPPPSQGAPAPSSPATPPPPPANAPQPNQ
jgi:hypothetical protein